MARTLTRMPNSHESVRQQTSGIDQILKRIQSDFIEMPGLRLTAWQAQRLWNVDPVICDSLLSVLVETGFLTRATDGAFMRPADPVARVSRGAA